MLDERLPWFKCIPPKLLGALAAMEPHEGYVYVVVLLRIYETGGACPDTEDALARRTGYPRRKVTDALSKLVESGKLKQTDAGWTNPFAESILTEREQSRERSQNSGKQGAKKRWQKHQRKQQTIDGPGMGTLLVSDGEREEYIDTALPNGKARHSPKNDWPPDGFNQFWEKYPHKIGKADARKAFDRAGGRCTTGWVDVMGGLARYVAKTDDRPWCNPATWLNQERWGDQPAPPPPGPGGRPRPQQQSFLSEAMGKHGR